MLLSTAYLPPLSWLALVASGMTLSADRVSASSVTLEACENYQKQTYRNRCRIYTANGVENLNVPIVHEGGSFSLPITEIKVDYSTTWVQRTERALCSAYDMSAYFEYYKDELFSIFDSHPLTLWELNLRLLHFLFEKTGLAVNLAFTQSFESSVDEDYRDLIHPKRPDTILRDLGLEKPYFQVFARKYGFQPNLSALDLLFNEGPDSIVYLKKL